MSTPDYPTKVEQTENPDNVFETADPQPTGNHPTKVEQTDNPDTLVEAAGPQSTGIGDQIYNLGTALKEALAKPRLDVAALREQTLGMPPHPSLDSNPANIDCSQRRVPCHRVPRTR